MENVPKNLLDSSLSRRKALLIGGNAFLSGLSDTRPIATLSPNTPTSVGVSDSLSPAESLVDTLHSPLTELSKVEEMIQLIKDLTYEYQPEKVVREWEGILQSTTSSIELPGDIYIQRLTLESRQYAHSGRIFEDARIEYYPVSNPDMVVSTDFNELGSYHYYEGLMLTLEESGMTVEGWEDYMNEFYEQGFSEVDFNYSRHYVLAAKEGRDVTEFERELPSKFGFENVQRYNAETILKSVQMQPEGEPDFGDFLDSQPDTFIMDEAEQLSVDQAWEDYKNGLYITLTSDDLRGMIAFLGQNEDGMIGLGNEQENGSALKTTLDKQENFFGGIFSRPLGILDAVNLLTQPQITNEISLDQFEAGFLTQSHETALESSVDDLLELEEGTGFTFDPTE